MNEFLISAHGIRMPKIIYGTAWKKERTAALVEQALSLGFRGIDTACQPKHYNESGVGEGLSSALAAGLERKDIYLQSKFTPLDGQDPNRIPYDPRASLADQVSQSFAASLANIKTTYLDCLVLHSPLSGERRTLEAWRAMEAVFEMGGASQLGISNCYHPNQLQALYEAAKVKPSVLQNRFYADTGYDQEIRAYCRQHGVQYQSFWTLTANPHLLRHEAISSLAAKYGRTGAQIFFRYLTQSGIVPLTGTASAEHMREDLSIFDFELAEDDLERIFALLE